MILAAVTALTGKADNTLNEVTVWGQRPMRHIGLQRTALDSTVLRENVALSMADVLTFNSSIFVKNAGRATLSTASFRGTSPSHTQVTWNGMRINSPMLGMTDFSTIPAFFIDQASLLHGTSSIVESGGGMGGLVSLSTTEEIDSGLRVQYVQGIGSFKTFDEYGRVSFGRGRWETSTRLAYSSSPNDYKYINHDKKLNIYDGEHNITGQYHPTERNRSGAYKDLHLLQEVKFDANSRNRLRLSAWYVNSNRELPLLATDYGRERDFENRQREQTLRSALSWKHYFTHGNFMLRGGYIHTSMAYDYRREVSEERWATLTRSRSEVNTFFGQLDGEWHIGRHWLVTANLSAHQHLVKSTDKSVMTESGSSAFIGYDKARIELSGSVSAKWKPVDAMGIALVLRQEMFGSKWAPLIPALFVDGLVSRRGNIILRASASRNHRFPTLNDLYFLPGGNPRLKNESGYSWDAGGAFRTGAVSGSLTWFDSRINDWILWLPTTKGFFSPRNVRKVHSYGLEAKASVSVEPFKGWKLRINGSYSFTSSVNVGNPLSDADRSAGKQLPYVPRHSASFTGRLSWRGWSFLYKWAYYSERYTMSSNDKSLTGHLPAYFMNNLSLEKSLSFRPLDLQLKLVVNNLFDEDYLSVLSRPMPGINFEFFIAITPRFQ